MSVKRPKLCTLAIVRSLIQRAALALGWTEVKFTIEDVRATRKNTIWFGLAPVLRKSRLPSKINLNDEDWLHCAIGANLLENIDRERSKKQYENAKTVYFHM